MKHKKSALTIASFCNSENSATLFPTLRAFVSNSIAQLIILFVQNSAIQEVVLASGFAARKRSPLNNVCSSNEEFVSRICVCMRDDKSSDSNETNKN